MGINTSLEYLRHPSCGGKTEFETMIGEYMKRFCVNKGNIDNEQ